MAAQAQKRKRLHEAISYGVIKMNIDTDTQWATWEGIMKYYKKNEGYLQGQIGNPEGKDKPNKKFYDPAPVAQGRSEIYARKTKNSFPRLECC